MHVIWSTVQHGHFPYKFKNKYTIFRVEGVSDPAYELFSCVGIAVNHILTTYGHLVHLHCDCFFGGLKVLYIAIAQKI